MVFINFLILNGVKLGSKIIKVFSLGSGSTWPGHIALKLNNHFLGDLISKSKVKVVLIAGTNGKTTTSSLLRYILENNGKKVFQNEEGANLLNGLASSIIKKADILGKIDYDYAIFEIDENSLPLVLKQISPAAVIILNLFRDQLDRYGEVNTIAAKWKKSFKSLTKDTQLFLNADDPQINYLGKDTKATVNYFGLSDKLMEKKEIPHDVDSVYCPNCGERLIYEKMSYSHLGIYSCPKGDFLRERVVTYSPEMLKSNLKGVYNYYNISAVFLVSEMLLNIPIVDVQKMLTSFKPAFGRQEVITYQGKNIFLLLSKNPTGFNQSIEAIKDYANGKKHTVLLALNDRIPDGRDISWIWDVEFQNVLPLAKELIISGDRTYDMALRIKYCFEEDVKVTSKNFEVVFESVSVIDDLKKAIKTGLDKTEKDSTLIILATYSAMLETRELLVGRKLL